MYPLNPFFGASCRLLLAGCVVVFALSGCAPDEVETPPEPASTTEAVAPQEYTATGIVRAVTPSSSHATIAHDDIPGFMAAMTMPFALADTSLARSLTPGDSIRFVFTSGENGVVVQEVTRLGRAETVR